MMLDQDDAAIRRRVLTPPSRWIRSAKGLEKKCRVDAESAEVKMMPDTGIPISGICYMIEDGHVTAPLKNCTLIGNGPDALTKVSMVGSDLQLDEGVGTCGKDGQSVPVGVGIPTLKLDSMTVGGTAR